MKIVLLFITASFIFLFVFGNGKSTAQNNKVVDSLKKEVMNLEKTNTQLIHVVDSLKKQNASSSLKISFSDLNELKSLLKKETSILDFIPSLIAILVVIISTYGAYLIGIKQLKKQEEASKEQIKTQQSIANDQLEQARYQIEATSIMTLTQVRANNISQARINWIENLRDNLSKYMGEVTLINYNLQQVINEKKKGNEDRAKQIYNDTAEIIKNARVFATKVRLYLNTNRDNSQHNDIDHNKLEKASELFMEKATNYHSVNNDADFDTISEELIETAKRVLKQAWEQAKKEGSTLNEIKNEV